MRTFLRHSAALIALATGLAAGTALWVETTDPLAVIDMPHFCREHGHLLEATEAADGFHRFLIRKGAGGALAIPDGNP